MENITQIWERLKITPENPPDLADLKQQKDLGFIKSFADKVKEKQGLPDVVLTASDCLSGAVNYLIDLQKKPDGDYLEILTSLIQIYPALLMGKDFAVHAKTAKEVMEKLKVLQNLDISTINPTQTSTYGKKMLGNYLIDLKYITQEQMDGALAEQKQGLHPGLRLGDILQAKNIITRAQLDHAIEEQMVDNME